MLRRTIRRPARADDDWPPSWFGSIRRPERPAHAVLDEVPQSIRVFRLKSDDSWWLATTHGATFETHDHIEIRLDLERLLDLWNEVNAAVMAYNKISKETTDGNLQVHSDNHRGSPLG